MLIEEYGDILDQISFRQPAQRHQPLQQPCQFCGNQLTAADTIECPHCGGISIDRTPVRRDENRPQREVVRSIESENHNGSYTIYKNSDGSHSCTCLSFLFQRGVQNGTGFATCKHIRSEVELMQVNDSKPSKWQLAALKRFGVEPSESLTNTQAYFLFKDLLFKQGIEYREYRDLLKEHQSVSLLPIYSFGVEFEGGVRDKEELKQRLLEAGISTRVTSYGHALMSQWKITTDGSVRAGRGFTPIELVSPKLFGVEGFEQIKKALETWKGVGDEVNRSCGTHVHVDAWNWDTDLMLQLAMVWAKIEVPVIWHLVSPSRRGGSYSRQMGYEYFDLLSSSSVGDLDRYYSLNIRAFVRHNTLEFRIHNGTTEVKKIIPWIVFVLKLVDAVKRGLRHHTVEATFDGVMDAVGMGSNATSLIRNARSYLSERFQHWSDHAEKAGSRAYPNGLPEPFDPAAVERELREMQRGRDRLRILRRYSNRRERLTQRDESLPYNSIHNLANMMPSSIIDPARFVEVEEGHYTAPAQSGEQTYDVIFDIDNDTLTCNCRGFRRVTHCYHSINLARHILTQRQLAELDSQAASIGGSDV